MTQYQIFPLVALIQVEIGGLKKAFDPVKQEILPRKLQ